MGWIVEQRDPAGEWSIIRATVDEREDAENLARLYKDHNPKLRFRFCRADEYGVPLDGSDPVEV